MKKTHTISFFIAMFASCLCSLSMSAQSQLTGSVRDKADSSPVPYATAALMRTDSSVVKGVMSDDNGQFILTDIEPGDYLLQVSFIGYDKVYHKLNVPAESDLGNIFLSESTNLLKEVVVSGKRALVEQRLDRIVVNVSGNIITSGLNINDLLKQLPGLVIDQNGEVKLNGRSATVYIDGRPTRLPAEQVAQMLTGMMGDVVDRVELIDNPSSRYEADMGGAIVNIRLRRDASLGLNGTAQAGVGFTEYDFAWRGGLNLNYRSRKLNIFGNYGYNDVPWRQDMNQIRNYGGTIPLTYDQKMCIRQKRPVHTLRAGIDWFVAPKQTIGFLFNGTFNDSDSENVSQADISQTGSSWIDSIILADARNTSSSRSHMYNLNYRLDRAQSGVLTADLDYGRVHHKQYQNMQSRYQDPDGNELRPFTEFQYNGPRDIDIYSLKVDYEKPLSDYSNLEAGVKAGQTLTDNEILYENLNEDQWEFDPSQSNRFKYTERVSAGYATYSHRFGKFSAMAGLRAEYTSLKGESVTMDTTFRRNYIDWFPSAYLQYQISENQALNLSYSRKITRPGFGLLNPFRMYGDPFTFSSGNPDLTPTYSNTATLRYNIRGYSANLSYSMLNDIFEQDYVQDDVNRTMGFIPQNIGKRQQVILSIFAPFKVVNWYAFNLSSQVKYTMADTRHSGEKFDKNYVSAVTSLIHNFTFSPSFRATMYMMWIKPTYEGFIRIDDVWLMNAQVEKTFMDRRLSLTLACNDILSSTYKVTGTMRIGNINQTFKQNAYQRQAMLTVRYSFGSQQIRGARNRNVGIEEEMNRTR